IWPMQGDLSAQAASRKSEKTDDPLVIVETDKGTFKIRVFQEDLPVTGSNFIKLVKKGFYNGLTFHRYESDFLIQGGDPTATGTGGSGEKIPLETNDKLKHSQAGMVGMGRKSDPNSGTSQFYIILQPRSELDGKYSVFGKVEEGFETVFQLRKGDHMTAVYIDDGNKKKKR
ncbi:MAG: peptidylprolyl isomerase, partial [Candidatus Obscuribacterales bacterium]|nr:peptidylprolyl isomerase [Candidatus Obscuribacterales bacterium]